MGLAEEMAGRTPPGVEVLTGTVSDVNATTAVVTINVGGNTFRSGQDFVLAAPGYCPAVGDPVAVLRTGARLVCLGYQGAPLPPVGKVAALPSGSTMDITVAGQATTLALPYVASYTSPAVNDQVALLWQGGPRSGLVLGKVGNAAAQLAPAPPPAPPPGAPTSGVATFTPVGVGTWRSGWRTDDLGDVIQGTAPSYPGANEGAFFYGGQPRSTLAGATVTDAQIYLGRTQGGAYAPQACHLYRVTADTRPAGALVFGTGPYDISLATGQSGWFTFSAAIAQELVTSGGSLGIKGSPYMRMVGLSKSGSAGALRLSWRR